MFSFNKFHLPVYVGKMYQIFVGQEYHIDITLVLV